MVLVRSKDGPPEKTIFSYLMEDHGANHLAQFPLVVGKGELQHTRLVQKELLYALSPSLASTDQILIPEENFYHIRLNGFLDHFEESFLFLIN